jgi:alpha-ketoglutarate-dependent taurine dioxygenase
MLSPDDIKILDSEGWIKKNIGIASKEELLYIGELLGQPVSSRNNNVLIDELRPLEKNQAKINSLSSKFGTKSFPFHTDTAYKKIPVRYIILYAINPGAGHRTTLLVDGLRIFDLKVNKSKLESAIFKIKNGRYSFITNMIEINKDATYRIRFDLSCMIPATRESIVMLNKCKKLIEGQEIIELEWVKGDLLILDNWRMLHGRGSVQVNDDDRLLYRLNIL